jgi:hypothetical protein
MNNYKIALPLFVITLLCLGLFSSCSENNPIIHTNDPVIADSNYFDWKFDTLQVMVASGMYIADTNNIFIPTYHNYMININNGTVKYKNYNDNDFAGWCIAGTSNNNVYIGGSSISLNRSKLKMWNGSVIKDIIMPIDTSTYIARIEAISENELWISTTKNIIYHYLNNSFTTYRLDSELEGGVIYKDNYGGVFALLGKNFQGTYDYLFYMFKFENNSWVEISKDSVSANSEMQDYIGFSDNKMLRSGKTGLYCFTGSSWEKYVNLPNSLSGILRCWGRDAGSLLFQADEDRQSYFFYYDGKQFYRLSNNIFPYLGLESLQYKFGRYYITTGEDFLGNSFFGTAKFK